MALDVAVQLDGKIIAAGFAWTGSDRDIALVRYTPGGVLDSTFGSGGKLTTPVTPDTDDTAYALAVQPDGRIVAAGNTLAGTSSDFALVRYTSNGSLDPTFGSGGKVVTSLRPSYDTAYAVAIQPDGKIVAAGQTWDGLAYDFAVVRYTSTGALDATFGIGGKIITEFGSTSAGAYDMLLQPDGKIVLAGYSCGSCEFALARYTSTGALDSTFGTGGMVTTLIGSTGAASGVALQADGKIVVAGTAYHRSSYPQLSRPLMSLARYTAAGGLDPTFDGDGTVVTPFGPRATSTANDVAVQADGKIVAVGVRQQRFWQFAVARFEPTGTLDPAFGTGGKVITSIGTTAGAYAMAIQPDGKIVAAGIGGYGGASATDFGLARYLP
ncbi:MAG: delta-60 repeat domain-containing protein [Actinomycetota bacterium]